MDLRTRSSDRRPVRTSAGERHDVKAIPSLAIWCGLNAIALVVIARWFSGSAPLRLTALPVYGSTVVVSLLNLAALLILRSAWHDYASRGRQWGVLLLSLNPFLVLAASSASPGPAYVSCLAGVLTLLMGELCGPGRPADVSDRSADASPVPLPLRRLDRSPESRAVPMTQSLPLDGGIGDWTSRTSDGPGQERLQGGTVVELTIGQKQAVVHLAFCPPFAATPEFECDSGDDSASRLKVAAIYPYGVRIEIKRSEACQSPTSVKIRYTAVLRANPSNAAA